MEEIKYLRLLVSRYPTPEEVASEIIICIRNWPQKN